MSQIRIDPLAGVHPADRKFYSGSSLANRPVAASIQLAAEAADLKLQDASYIEFLIRQIEVDALNGVHPADVKFFNNWDRWVAPSINRGAATK